MMSSSAEPCRLQDLGDGFEVEFLLVTTAPIEQTTVLEKLEPLSGRKRVLKVGHHEDTYYVGKIGRYVCALVRTEQSSDGRAGSHQAVNDAIERLKPRGVIAVGIAFGNRHKSQVLGDVLVSSKVTPYDHRKETPAGKEYRGAEAEAGIILKNRVEHLDWTWDHNGEQRKAIVGPLLTGNVLVNSAEFRDGLFTDFPEAIGGEMEASGVSAAARRKNKEWIIIKGVCDWGANKTKDHQGLAARNATSLLYALLSEPSLHADDFARVDGRPLGHLGAGDIVKTAASLALHDHRRAVREASDTLKKVLDEISAIAGQGFGNPTRSPKIRAQARLLAAKREASAEALLNALDDAASATLAGSINRGECFKVLRQEFIDVFNDDKGAIASLLGKQPMGFQNLRKLHSEIVFEDLRASAGDAADLLAEGFRDFKIGAGHTLPFQSLMGIRSNWSAEEQDLYPAAVEGFLSAGLVQETEHSLLLKRKGYEVLYLRAPPKAQRPAFSDVEVALIREIYGSLTSNNAFPVVSIFRSEHVEQWPALDLLMSKGLLEIQGDKYLIRGAALELLDEPFRTSEVANARAWIPILKNAYRHQIEPGQNRQWWTVEQLCEFANSEGLGSFQPGHARICLTLLTDLPLFGGIQRGPDGCVTHISLAESALTVKSDDWPPHHK